MVVNHLALVVILSPEHSRLGCDRLRRFIRLETAEEFLLAFGIRQLITAKRIEQSSTSKRTAMVPTAGFGRDGAWLGVAGRF